MYIQIFGSNVKGVLLFVESGVLLATLKSCDLKQVSGQTFYISQVM